MINRTDIAKAVIKLSIPVIFTNLLQSLVAIVDVYIAGRLGSIELAAVGMSNTVRFLLFFSVMAVTAGEMALAAQAYGSGDKKRLQHVGEQSVILTLLVAFAIMSIGFLAVEPLLNFMNGSGEAEVVVLASSYLRWIFAGAAFLMTNFSVNSLMQATGDTLTPMILSIIVVVLNLILSFAFAFGYGFLPEMGLVGIAIGTVFSRLLGAIIGMSILFLGWTRAQIKKLNNPPDWQLYKEILLIGIPSALQGVTRNGSSIFLFKIINATAASTFGVAGLAVALQIESLAFMPGLAIGVAATSLVGQAIGRWQLKEAKVSGDMAIILGMIVMGAIAIPIYIFAPQLILFFNKDANPTVIKAGSDYLRINAGFEPILAVAMVLSFALRGAGDTRPGLTSTILARWIVMLPFAYLSAIYFGLGVTAIWWAMVLAVIVSAAYLYIRWQSLAWQAIGLKTTAIYKKHLIHLSPEKQEQFLEAVKIPLMQEKSAVEEIDDMGAVYKTNEARIVVRFANGDFKIV